MTTLDSVAQSLRPRVSVRGRPIERATIEDRMAELHVPAVSFAVLDGDEVVCDARGADAGTLFQAASISKPVSAIAAVRLAADSVVDLDAEVNDILRTWQLPDGDGVTIRRILAHSAGLSVHGFPGYAQGAEIPSLVQILDGAPPANTEAVRVVRPPGEAFQYSGGGYTLLQLLLEDVTGEPFPTLMRRVLLDPLDMAASTYEQPLPEDRMSAAATAHGLEGNAIAGGWHVYPEQAAAGLWTNPRDLLRVAAEMIEPGRVLHGTLRDEMLTPFSSDFFGLGWQLDPPWFEHGGSNEGFRCLLYASVAHRKAAAVMTNSDGGGLLCADLVAAIAEVFGWPDYLREREAIDLDSATLDAIAGDYEIEPDFVVSVRHEDGTLVSFAPGIPKRETFAASPTNLFRTDLDADIEWTPDGIILRLAGTSIEGRRL